jgi:hypothetical protein
MNDEIQVQGDEGKRFDIDSRALAHELCAAGAATTPQALAARGVKRIVEFKSADIRRIVAAAVDRASAANGRAFESRNALVEESMQDLEAQSDLDPFARIELLERRLAKSTQALDRAERALFDVLDDAEIGLAAVREYVAALPDDHPLRRVDAFELLANGRGRGLRAEPTEAEKQRAHDRRRLLAALAEVNKLHPEPLTMDAEDAPAAEAVAAVPAERDSKRSAFAELTGSDLRLTAPKARPFRGRA